MRPRLVLAAFALLLFATPEARAADVHLGFTVGIDGAPAPPRVLLRGGPDVVLVPGTRVYVVENEGPGYDMFRYGSSWYVMRGGYWYRSANYRGPYRVVDVRRVPRPVLMVPSRYWSHHPHGGPPGLKGRGGPPGQVKKRG